MNKEQIFDEIINMGIKNHHEATDMLIALYGYMDKKFLADIQIILEQHYKSN